MQLPAGFWLGEALMIDPGDDPHVQGRLAATRALAQLLGDAQFSIAYDGTRPIVVGAEASISITHGRSRALAVAAAVPRLGIDLVDDADEARLAKLADRFLAGERTLAITPETRAACFAAKEAGLKALGLGLLDGGVFDDCAVRVVSLVPPRIEPASLELVLGRVADGTVAIAFSAL